jgi:hypothetical protein
MHKKMQGMAYTLTPQTAKKPEKVQSADLNKPKFL